jgi:hypothetical protein
VTSLTIWVDGRLLALDALYGDVQHSTVWPGGSDQLSWTLGTQPARRFRGGKRVDAYYGPIPVFSGSLQEPDASQDQMTALGAWREGQNYPALTSGGAASTIPDQAIDQATSRGLQWSKPNSISSSSVAIDVSQGPAKLGALLDTYCDNQGLRWGLTPQREIYAKADDTTPTYQTLPLDRGLGYALDNYASTLYGRYFDSTTSTYQTTPPATDATAEGNHGHVEDTVDLTSRGPITAAKATSILNNLLLLGRAVPQWTTGITLSYGEIFDANGSPVALELVAAGLLLRIPGGLDMAMRLNGAMYLDVPIGRTSLASGVLTIQPADVVVGNLHDALTAALMKK